MEYTHEAQSGLMDLNPYISRHSADEVFAYKEFDGQKLLLGLYYPRDYAPHERSYPVFVLVHGGGWAGRKIFSDQADWAGDYLGYLARYYAEQGFVAASIDYRLLRDNGQAAGYELGDLCGDCQDAVDWLRERSAQYGLDFSRSVVLGESAGGHLAGMLATYDPKGKPVFSRAILVNAITDLFDPVWSSRVAQKSASEKTRAMSLMERSAFLSPVAHVSGQTCPVMLIHGAADSVVDPEHSASFYCRMQACQRPAELHWIADTNHAFLLAEYADERGVSRAAAETTIQLMQDFVAALL